MAMPVLPTIPKSLPSWLGEHLIDIKLANERLADIPAEFSRNMW